MPEVRELLLYQESELWSWTGPQASLCCDLSGFLQFLLCLQWWPLLLEPRDVEELSLACLVWGALGPPLFSPPNDLGPRAVGTVGRVGLCWTFPCPPPRLPPGPTSPPMKESRALPQGVKPLECGTLTPGSGASWVDLAWETGRTQGRGEECFMASGWDGGKGSDGQCSLPHRPSWLPGLRPQCFLTRSPLARQSWRDG